MWVQGDSKIEPTTANYTFKHILEVQNNMYEIDLCPSQLKGVRICVVQHVLSMFMLCLL